ncbi:MAG: hypothetical protein GC129_04110 [Proteobacteria bacterium]|nr:hypothetical protein [Pseudomonadota bacterium]
MEQHFVEGLLNTRSRLLPLSRVFKLMLQCTGGAENPDAILLTAALLSANTSPPPLWAVEPALIDSE